MTNFTKLFLGLGIVGATAVGSVGCKMFEKPEPERTGPTLWYRGQDPGSSTGPQLQDPQLQQTTKPANPANMVAGVKITGNSTIPEHHLMRYVRTRVGRYYDPDKLQQDIEDISKMKKVLRVNRPTIRKTDQGVFVTIEIIERRFVRKVSYLGNRAIADWTLKKQSGIRAGEPLDTHAVKMARQRIENYYHEKGFPRTQVEIAQGDKIEHSDVVFIIHEDKKQRIFKTNFVGNKIASDGRLRSFIKSKPGILWLFGGSFNKDKILQDQKRLTAYYRSLGFFNARVGREIIEHDNGFSTVRFIVDEGPRYKVRSISFAGNQRYRSQDLATLVDLKPTGDKNPYFNSAKMAKDVNSLRDMYGSQGHVFADVQAEPRFLEEPGLLDIVYKISEGKQYRVGQINVHIAGDYGVTRREVVLNRLGLKPGELIDSRKLRSGERRLASAQIFSSGQGGPPPKVVVRTPEIKELERMAGNQENSGGSSSKNFR